MSQLDTAIKRLRLHFGGVAVACIAAMACVSTAIAEEGASYKKLIVMMDGSPSSAITDTTSSAGGKVVAEVPIRMDRLWTSLEERRMRLDRLISDNIFHGVLSSDQALRYRRDLDEIAGDLYRSMAADTFTADKAIELAARMDGVSERMSVALNEPPLPKLVVLDDSTGKTQLVTEFFGDVITSKALDVNVFKQTLKERRQRLGELIAGGQASGVLGAAQTDKLRIELDDLAGLEKALAENSNPRYAHVLQLAMHYDSVRARLAQLMDLYDMKPLVNDSSILVRGKTVVRIDEPMRRRARLEERISRELATGHLTGSEGAHLRDMLNQLAAKESTFRAHGSLNQHQQKQLRTGFDKVANRLDATTL